jgi:hypothetical protein
MVETVHYPFHRFAMTARPNAFGVRDTATTHEKELFPQLSRVDSVPSLSGMDTSDNLLLVLIPFVHCP